MSNKWIKCGDYWTDVTTKGSVQRKSIIWENSPMLVENTEEEESND